MIWHTFGLPARGLEEVNVETEVIGWNHSEPETSVFEVNDEDIIKCL